MPVLSGALDRSLDGVCPVLVTTLVLSGGIENAVESLLNPFGADFIVIGATVRSTAASGTAGAVLNVGIANTAAASDILIDGLDIATATFPASAAAFGIADTVTNAGSNGVNAAFWRSTDYLTATYIDEEAAAFRGVLYVYGFIA